MIVTIKIKPGLLDIGQQLTKVCYFNKPNDDEYYDVFISKRIKAENFSERIYFKIERVRGKTEKENL